jgi:hypothetical protein
MAVRKIKPPVIIPIPQPTFVPQGGRPWFRSRMICFNMDDWRAFGDALQIACPYARYFRRTNDAEYNPPEPPSITLWSHVADAIEDCKASRASDVTIAFDPDWQLEYEKSIYSWTWSRSCPDPKAYFDVGPDVRREEEGGPDYMRARRFVMSLTPGNSDHIAFGRAFFSLMGQFSSNRHQCSVLYPTYERYAEHRSGTIWIGHRAIRWLLDDSTRLIDYNCTGPYGPPQKVFEEEGYGWGQRPMEERWREKLGLT